MATKRKATKSQKPAAAQKPVKTSPRGTLYGRIMGRANARVLAESRAARDIAPAPGVADRPGRTAAAASLRTFLELTFPETFRLVWSADHLQVLAELERVITDGGQLCLAMPRGSGKTSILERAALWGLLTGRRRFVVLVAANESLAEQMLNRLKSELERNDVLLAHWPRTAYPIRRLEAQGRRTVGQLYEGGRTAIVWQRKRLVLPTMPGPDNEASGGVLHAAGLTGAVRGLLHVDGQGRTIRPDLVLIDDPQTRESAGSAAQTAERLALMNGDLLGLAGPGARIAALVGGTVIHRSDLIDRLLDRDQSPAWQGRRYGLLRSPPTAEAVWEQYRQLRADGMRAGDGTAEATAFYVANRPAMDAGAAVAWPQRFNPDEASAVQHAMNLKIDLGDAFDSEYQNAPRRADERADALDADAIAARVNMNPRGTAGVNVERVTAFADVGQGVLWWVVCGWSEAFDCEVLDYGPWPRQPTRMFTARNAARTLEAEYPTGGPEAAVYAGLRAVTDDLFARKWTRTDGAELPLWLMMIDTGWATDVVRTFVRQSPRRHQLLPSKGMGIGPGQTPMSEYRKRPGERLGHGWVWGSAGPDGLRLLRYDANQWKTRMAGMLTRPMGSRGGVTLAGPRAADHAMLGMHLSSEVPTPTSAKGVTVNLWTRIPNRDNHLWDCLVGAAVAASVGGLRPLARVAGPAPTTPDGTPNAPARPPVRRRKTTYYS